LYCPAPAEWASGVGKRTLLQRSTVFSAQRAFCGTLEQKAWDRTRKRCGVWKMIRSTS